MLECEEEVEEVNDERETFLSVCIIILDKVLGLLPSHTINVADLVPKTHAIEFMGILEQLRPERGRNKLCSVTQFMDHISYRLTMHCIQSLSKNIAI